MTGTYISTFQYNIIKEIPGNYFRLCDSFFYMCRLLVFFATVSLAGVPTWHRSHYSLVLKLIWTCFTWTFRLYPLFFFTSFDTRAIYNASSVISTCLKRAEYNNWTFTCSGNLQNAVIFSQFMKFFFLCVVCCLLLRQGSQSQTGQPAVPTAPTQTSNTTLAAK